MSAALAPALRPEPRLTVAALLERPASRHVVLASSKDENAKVTVLLLPSGSDDQPLAVKLPTTDGAAAAVAREARLLRELERANLGPLTDTVPRVVDILAHDGRAALLTTLLAGTPMARRYHGWRHTARPRLVAADFAAVGRWLAELQAATTQCFMPLDMASAAGGDVPSLLATRFAGEPRLPGVLDALAAGYAELSGARTPRTVVHGDLWFGNVLLRAGRVSGVVDWEAGESAGEPVRDLVRFALSYALYLDRHTAAGHRVAGHRSLRADGFGAGIRYALTGAGWLPELVRGFICDGLERLCAPARLWWPAALAGVAEVAATSDETGFASDHFGLLVELTHHLPRSLPGTAPAHLS